MSECSRALSFNKDDIQSAATWLTDEGERERLKQTVVARQVNTSFLFKFINLFIFNLLIY